MAGTEYQATDAARIRAVLDASLSSSLSSILTFDGFFGPGEEIPRSSQQPVHPDEGNPRGAVAWAPDYPLGVSEMLDGSKRTRQVVVRFQVRRQVDPSETAYDDVLAVQREISDRFEALASEATQIPSSAQDVFSLGIVQGWPEWGFFLPLWST